MSPRTNKQVDWLIAQAAQETDEATRKQLYGKLRLLALEEAPIVFVHYETINYGMRKAVTGSTINPTLELRLENVGMSA